MTESGNSPTIVIPAKFQWIKINTPTPIKQWTEYLRKLIFFPYRVANRKEFRVRNDFEKFFQNLLLWEESFVVNLTREPNVLNFRNKRFFFQLSTYNDHVPRVAALNIRHIKRWAIVILFWIFVCDCDFKIPCRHLEFLHLNYKTEIEKKFV